MPPVAAARLGAELAAFAEFGVCRRWPSAGATVGAGRPGGRCRRLLRASALLRGGGSRSALLERRRVRRRSGPLKLAEQPLPFRDSLRIRGSWSASTSVRPKWPYLVEAVERRGRVVDQVDQAVPALGLLRCWRRTSASSVVGATPVLASSRRLAHDRVGFARRSGPDGFAGRRRGSSAPRSSASENGVSSAGRVGQRRRRLAEVGEDRRGGVGEALQAAHRQCGTRAGRWGTSAATLPAAAPRSELAWAAAPELAKKPATWARSRESGPRICSESAASWASWSRWAERMPKRRSTSRRTGLARLTSRLDVVAAAGEAGAEFVEDQPEALRVGQRLDVVDQVRVDAGAVAAERQQVLAGARLRRRGSASAAAAAGEPGARGRVGRQSTNFSPISDCGRIWQLASLRKSWKPGSVMFITITALPGTATGLPSAVGDGLARHRDADRLDRRRRWRRRRGPARP